MDVHIHHVCVCAQLRRTVCGHTLMSVCVYHWAGFTTLLFKYKPRVVVSVNTHTHCFSIEPPRILYLCRGWEGEALGQAGLRVRQSRGT